MIIALCILSSLSVVMVLLLVAVIARCDVIVEESRDSVYRLNMLLKKTLGEEAKHRARANHYKERCRDLRKALHKVNNGTRIS